MKTVYVYGASVFPTNSISSRGENRTPTREPRHELDGSIHTLAFPALHNPRDEVSQGVSGEIQQLIRLQDFHGCKTLEVSRLQV